MTATRLLVVSDLHAFVGPDSDKAPSLMSMQRPGGKGHDLLAKCARIVLDHCESVDVVVVTGDLTDRADSAALTEVWKQLNVLADELGAVLVATAGNHDYDSRGVHDVNARGALIDLTPHFPINDESAKLSYFTYDYALNSSDSRTVVTLNSAAQHGYGDEYLHGRVSRSALRRLELQLTQTPPAGDRVLVVHHQPAQLPGIDSDEISTMVDGQELLEILGRSGDWLVIHGHKHRPYMQWAAGGTESPLLMSAAAFSANTGGNEFGAMAPNQFHVVEFASSEERSRAGVSIGGRISTWTYNSFDWIPSSLNEVFPASSGFGWRGSMKVLAAEAKALLEANGGRLDAAALDDQLPMLQFLSFADLKSFRQRLKDLEPQSEVDFETNGRIRQISTDLPTETEADL